MFYNKIKSLIIFILIINISYLKANTIAILSVHTSNTNENQKNANNRINQFGKELIAILAEQKRYELIEQEKIEEIYKELQKGQTGLVDQENAAQLGRLKGIHYFIFYDFVSFEDNKSTGNFRIVHTETGTIIGGGKSNGSYEEILKELSEKMMQQLDIYLNLDNPQSPYSVLLKLNKEKPIYKVGETLQVTFKVIPHQNAKKNKVYIQLFSIDSKGKITLIYPNKFSSFDPVDVNKEYTFPSEKDDFEWELTPPAGTEYIQAFVSEEPVDIFGIYQKAKRELFPESNLDGNSITTYRSIQTKLKKDKIKNWSSMRIAYELNE